MLTAQLPFDVDEKVKNHLQTLIKTIMRGVENRHLQKLHHTSFALKGLVIKMLTVEPEQRVELDQVLQDDWTTEGGDKPVEVEPELTLTEAETQQILHSCKIKLGLQAVDADKILDHIR